jgi:hypothetical protein
MPLSQGYVKGDRRVGGEDDQVALLDRLWARIEQQLAAAPDEELRLLARMSWKAVLPAVERVKLARAGKRHARDE